MFAARSLTRKLPFERSPLLGCDPPIKEYVFQTSAYLVVGLLACLHNRVHAVNQLADAVRRRTTTLAPLGVRRSTSCFQHANMNSELHRLVRISEPAGGTATT